MKVISSTEFQNNTGAYLDECSEESITVNRSGRPKAVILSPKEYERMEAFEDFFWAMQAKKARKGGHIGTRATKKLLDSVS